MSWLILTYKPTTLFSLRLSTATSTTGRTLIIPTPYAVKMAFVDAAFRAGWEETRCRELVRRLVGVEIRIKPSERSVVTGTIQKIRQEERSERESNNLYVSNVAYREFVYANGEWKFAINLEKDGELSRDLIHLAPIINYFGKRGSMVQFCGYEWTHEIGQEFTVVLGGSAELILPERSHIVPMDDFGPDADFEHLNSFGCKSRSVTRGSGQRVLRDTLVPAGVSNAGPGFVEYSMVD